jgi:hypothetical protein
VKYYEVNVSRCIKRWETSYFVMRVDPDSAIDLNDAALNYEGTETVISVEDDVQNFEVGDIVEVTEAAYIAFKEGHPDK